MVNIALQRVVDQIAGSLKIAEEQGSMGMSDDETDEEDEERNEKERIREDEDEDERSQDESERYLSESESSRNGIEH